MAKYRKRPVVVDAKKYRRGLEDGFDCFGYEYPSPCCFDCGNSKEYRAKCIAEKRARPYINTLEGKHYIAPGDYIITGIKGERYPCKPDIFAATYEAVDGNG